jgi:hypothetical protein
MSGARWRAPAIAAALLIAGAMALLSLGRSPEPLPPRAPGDRPPLLLLTSLPILFGEHFSLEEAGSPAVKALRTRYRVLPISVTSPDELARGRLLLMAHPRAQPAEDLVALDDWVRGGGHVLLLADPMLEWPSQRPLGDALRPPPMFADTGLLAHWGLRLDAPDERGDAKRRFAGYRVMTISPGALSGDCNVSRDRLVARCAVGKGEATIVADADLLNVTRVSSSSENLAALLAELASLEQG